MKFPAKLGACIDLAYTLQQEYLIKQKEADEAKAKVEEVKEHIINTFPKTGLVGGKGELASASLSSSTVPQAKDWKKIFAYVKKADAWDLMYKRINPAAYRARVEEGEKVPGVEEFNVVKLSITKIGE